MIGDIDIPATITAVGALITAIGVILIGYWAYRGKERASAAADAATTVQSDLVSVKDEVYELGKRVDGRLSELLATKDRESAAAVQVAEAKGHAAGEQAQRDRASEAQP